VKSLILEHHEIHGIEEGDETGRRQNHTEARPPILRQWQRKTASLEMQTSSRESNESGGAAAASPGGIWAETEGSGGFGTSLASDFTSPRFLCFVLAFSFPLCLIGGTWRRGKAMKCANSVVIRTLAGPHLQMEEKYRIFKGFYSCTIFFTWPHETQN
jgi:hypothetical protein